MQVEVDVVSVEKPAYLNDVEQNRDDAAADVKATATRPPEAWSRLALRS